MVLRPDHQAPPTVGGRYAPQRLLGEGSRKRVFLARDLRLERDVALALIKTDGLDDAGRARVAQEVSALARLGDHPRVVTIFDVGEDDGQPYLVSQYLAGGTLEARLAGSQNGGLPIGEVVELGVQLCEALAHVHAAGITHRDLKPANVWLTASGAATLGDFGIAAEIGKARLTSEGLVLGTVAYLAPEQALAAQPDARSDLYSLGVVLYEALTGQLPFTGDDPVAVVYQHVHTPPVAPSWRRSGIPRGLESLVVHLLEKTPERRPASAAAVRDALARLSLAGPADDYAGAPVNPLDQLAGGVFVGRTAEMASLRRWLEEARGGHGRLALVSGEAGIGKTRTAEELATYARLRGVEVVWGRCSEDAGAPAFWPWVQVVRALSAVQSAATLRSLLGADAALVAALVPEIGEQLALDVAPTALPDSEEARFRLFDALSRLLRSAAEERPLLVVLDDLHGADASSLRCLEFIARELGATCVLALGTYRDIDLDPDHPLTHALGETMRAPSTQRVALVGLSEAEVGRFVELTAGRVGAAPVVRAVHGASEGNPFLVTEVVRLLIAEQTLDDPAPTLMVPHGVRAAVERRLAGLSAPARELLDVAAVVGREFDLDVIAQATGVSHADLLPRVEEAIARRFVRPGGSGRYRFLHALVQGALYDRLSPSRRVTLHGAIAAVLETHSEPRLAEIAHHFAEAGPIETEKAIEYSRRAADRAMDLLAYEEAVRLRRVAVTLRDRSAAPADTRLVELLLELGAAEKLAGDVAAARAAFDRAAAAARQLRSPELLARAALGISDERMWAHTGIAAAIPLLDEALAAVDEGLPTLRAMLQVSLAVWLFDPGDPRTVALVGEALSASRNLDRQTRLFVVRRAPFAIWGPDGPPAQRLALANEQRQLGEELQDRESVILGAYWAIQALFDLGDIERARLEADIFARTTAGLRQPVYEWFVLTNRIALALSDGALADAEALLPESVAAQESARFMVAGFRCYIDLLRGRYTDVAALIAGALSSQQQIAGTWQCAHAYINVLMGRDEEARRQLGELIDRDLSAVRRDINWLAGVGLLAIAVARLRESRWAEVLYLRLLPYAGRNIRAVVPVPWLGSMDRYLGLLAATLEQFDTAAAHFEKALEMNRRMGARPWLAWTQHDYAAMLLLADPDGNREPAEILLAAAVETAALLGMAPLAEAVRALRPPVDAPDAGRTVSSGETAPETVAQIAAARRYRILKTTEERVRAEVLARRPAPAHRDHFAEILGTTAAIDEMLALAESAAGTSLAVLLEGETGTGKELLARAIHRISPRGNGPFVPVNCAAIPDDLLESELFGHRKGAFTGATDDREGLVAAAAGGTLFLDEIGEMPAPMQAKLLRVLHDGELRRVGDTTSRRIAVRVISATNRDLAAEVAEGRFREDLYYRLAAFPIRLLALRERREDVPTLAAHCLAVAATRQGKAVPTLAPEAFDLLLRYGWPGNVRELENELARAVALVRTGEPIRPQHLSPRVRAPVAPPVSLASATEELRSHVELRGARADWEARHVAHVLAQHGGNVSRAAAALGLSRSMLHRKLRKLGLR